MLKKLMILLLNIYRFFSRFTPRRCRFYPTCSNYAMQAIEKYGVFKGVILGIKRLLRCNPYNPGGYDPLV